MSAASGGGAATPKLRAATASDLDAIWAIETAVFGGDAWSRDVMAAELTGEHRAYLALEGAGGVTLGYGGLLALGSEGDIQTIALDPAARGAGHGRQLMNALLDEAERRGVREVFLEVRADNPAARGLYESLGFEQLGVRPRYYQPDDVDAIVMRLDIARRRGSSRHSAAVQQIVESHTVDAETLRPRAARSAQRDDGGRTQDNEGERR